MKKVLLLLALVASPAHAGSELQRFITCPVYRDTDAGRKSGCWLADDPISGSRYDVSHSPSKPDWNREILVEGRIAEKQDNACGGITLDPVRTSILDGPCPRHMIPAEGFPGRRYVLQGRYVKPLAAPREVPPGPYGPKTFAIYFDFNQAFIIYQYDDFLLDRAATWLGAAKPKKIIVTGYAATRAETVTGRTIAERSEVAQERAGMIAEAMRRLLPGAIVKARWRTHATPTADPDADTIPGQSQRRAEITAEF